MDKEEYKKCCESPAYFFNNYILVKDTSDNWVKPVPVTDEQIIDSAKKAHKEYWKQMRVRRWKSFMLLYNFFQKLSKVRKF